MDYGIRRLSKFITYMKPPKKTRSRSSTAAPSKKKFTRSTKKAVSPKKKGAPSGVREADRKLRVVLVSSSSFLRGTLNACCGGNPGFSIVKWLQTSEEAAAFRGQLDVAVLDLENEKVSLDFARSLKRGAHAVGVARHSTDEVIIRALEVGVRSM